MTLLNKLELKIKNTKKDKKGFVAIETVISLCVVLMIILLFLGFWLYLYPRIVLEKEVHTLAQQAKITGGLSTEQVSDFEDSMDSLGYEIKSISVGTTSSPANDLNKYNGLINVYPKGGVGGTCSSTSYQNYVKRTSSDKIVITIQVRANNYIQGPLSFFKTITKLNDVYVLSETVMSERNKC